MEQQHRTGPRDRISHGLNIKYESASEDDDDKDDDDDEEEEERQMRNGIYYYDCIKSAWLIKHYI